MKLRKKGFMGIFTGPNTLFLDLKKFKNFFWLHLLPGTTTKKRFLNKVPNTGSSDKRLKL
jgi:hypothetical protein